MISDIILVVFVIIFWSLFVLAFRKRTSVIPTVPFFPVGLLFLGLVINHFCLPWGTVVIIVIHIVPVVFCAAMMKRKRRH